MSTRDLSTHPCFNSEMRHKTARIHLPVAPGCNVQCRFCSRDFDCVNESRPGVTSKILKPEQAVSYLEKIAANVPDIAVVGIAGPGDPFANPEETMTTLSLVREKFPDMLLCVATNGLGIGPYIDPLAELGTSHVTITVNGVDPEVVSKVYAWYRYDKRIHSGIEGAEELIARQLDAVKRLKEHGIIVKINTVIIPGINDSHVRKIAEVTSSLGADISNLIGMIPTAGTEFAHLQAPDAEMMKSLRGEAGEYLPQMIHCARCRADAAGKIGCSNESIVSKVLADVTGTETKVRPVTASGARKYLAVASMEGILVNQHLGEASDMLIYGKDRDGISRIEVRTLPEHGTENRWEKLSEILSDCHSVAVSGIGNKPRNALENSGLKILIVEGMIEEIAGAVFADAPLNTFIKRRETACGAECMGTGTGCG